MDIEYSDGAQIESRIRTILTQCDDLRSTTAIASERYADWPVHYHLCPERSHLLRPFDFRGLDVLELGAGMGAVSRFIAEKAKSLTVIEGTQSRFSALKERLRDLNNWSGSVGNIADAQFPTPFDVVCCIGVLEYSELYIKSAGGLSPFQLFLEKARSFLKPEGVLILAIENRLGLKYWNGSAEDHTGLLFDGICGYSDSPSPKTFSRKELLDLYAQAQFTQVDEFYPFPDYKLTSSVLSKDLIDLHPAIAADLATYAPYQAYGSPRSTQFSDVLAVHGLAKAGLLKEFSNSLLFVGSQRMDSPIRKQLLRSQIDEQQLAWHFSSNRSVPTKTIFRRVSGNELETRKFPLVSGEPQVRTMESELLQLTWRAIPNEPVLPGRKLREILANALYYGEAERALQLLKDFFLWSFEHWKAPEPNDLLGGALDAIFTNACQSKTETFELFDLEWSAAQPISKTWFVLRNLLALRADFSLLSALPVKNLQELYGHCLASLQIPLDLATDLTLEAELQSLVTHQSERGKYLAALRSAVKETFPVKVLAREPVLEYAKRTEYRNVLQERDALKSILSTPPHRIATYVDIFLQKHPRLQNLVRARRQLKGIYAKLKHYLPYVYAKYGIFPDTNSLASSQLIQLSPRFNALKPGWVKIMVQATGETSTYLSLHLQASGKTGKKCTVRLERTGENTYGATLRLYSPVERIDLPQNPKRPFTVELALLRQMTKAEAALRLILPQLPVVLRNPALRKDFFQRARTLWNQGKVRGLLAWVQQQALQGKVAFADFYSSWVSEYDELKESDRSEIKKRVRDLPYFPLISIIMPVYNTDREWLEAAIDSVLQQLYPNWELCIADDASPQPHVREVLESYRKKDPRIRVLYRETNGHISVASNSALNLAKGEFVALLDHDDLLTPDALYYVAEELNQYPKTDLLYSDEDKIDHRNRRFQPHFKPDWNPQLFYAYNLITHLCVMRRSLVESLGGFRPGFEGSQDYDLMLRVIEQTTNIRHIPKILYHWRAILSSVAGGPSAKPYAHEAARRAIQSHLDRKQINARIVPGFNDCHRVQYALPSPLPKVSCLICTRDRVDLLKGIVEGLKLETDYPNLEILIVDNQSQEAETLDYFAALSADPRIRILKYDAPFNFSAMNNLAAKAATGEILAILNNDLRVIHREWLKEMVSLALQKEIGAVGAKLLYPSSRLQHGGIILGIGGVAGHSHKGLGKYDVDFQARTRVIQNLSAVTAACLVIRKEILSKVGGFDEANLSIAFNDVDFCLRVREAGYQNVWTPYAELFHLESESRGSDETPENQPRFQKEVEYMIKRWGKMLSHDPAYNPNLTLERQDFTLAFPPRTRKPWEANPPR